MSSVVNFSEYLKTLVNSGSAIEGNVVKVIADNGDEIGDAIFKVVQGGNGVSEEVGVAVQTGASGATATGLAYLSLDVGVVGAAIAPALGVLAGVGLYELTPEFWTSVSNSLINAGKTVGGKVIGFWNGDNLHLDAETIEIFKNALIDAGIFETLYEPPEIDTQTTSITLEALDLSICKNQCIDFINHSCAGVSSTHKEECINYISSYNGSALLMVQHYYYYNNPENEYSIAVWSDSTPNDRPISYYNSTLGQDVKLFRFEGSRLFIRNRGGYYGDDATFLFNLNDPSYISIARAFNPSDFSGSDKCFPHFGTFEVNPNVQPDATLPTTDPFPLTYPNWLPWEYPTVVPDPSELPSVYPIKYPEVEPDPYPEQDPAQNPDPENAPDVYPVILPDFEINPNPTPSPGPTPQPDPDPQPEPDPIPEPEEPTPRPDPVDPNPDPTPSPIIPIVPLPATVSSNRLFTVYNPSESELNSLGAYLWDSSIIASIRDIWQNPLDGVISLIQVYATPPTSGRHNIILGFLDSGVGADVVSTQFITVDCGSVSIPENKFNATDYAPYTSLHLYLPFIGIVELDTNECMNSTINVKYKIDVYTGTCLATVSVTRSKDMPNSPILYTYSGNCSQQIPLTSGNATGMLTALIGGITAGLSVASGGGFGLVAGAQLASQTLTHEMFHVSHSGNISANAGIMGQKKPYLIIGRRHGYDANNYSSLYGYPANKTIVLGNHTGYVKIKHCFLKTSATQPEHDEIMSLLRKGVIL